MASDPLSLSLASPVAPSALASDYQALCQHLAHMLDIDVDALTPSGSLLQLGLDSMQLMQLLHWFRQRQYRVTLRELYHQPTLEGWHALMLRASPDPLVRSDVSLPPASLPPAPCALPTMTDGHAFPLTPVQHAYLAGRAPSQPLGGVGCHLYQEFDGRGLTALQLDRALRGLLKRHPMLQVAFRADGQQHYCPQAYWNGTTVHDLRTLTDTERDRYLEALRDRLSHRCLDVEHGETFDTQLSLLANDAHRLHVNIDLLTMDASSFTLFFNELSKLLAGETLVPLPESYDFCSYLDQYQRTYEAAIAQAKAYWQRKHETLPLAPELPLACDPTALTAVRFTRRRFNVPNAQWRAFCEQARAFGVTPTLALATCFSAVLSRWSGQTRLLLNLTLFDRLPLHEAVEGMLADFTNILLLDVACHGEPLARLAQKNQRTFACDREHSVWSGVTALRALKQQQRHPYGAPVVFTSNVGTALYATHPDEPLGAPGWGISQTPQVWLDHLAFEHQGDIILQWDSNDALFPPGLIETLFEAYTHFINDLCCSSTGWEQPPPDLMPAAQYAVRARVNATSGPMPAGLLHDGIIAKARQCPAATALIEAQTQWCYATLVDKALRCAQALKASGVTPGDTVAITMPKGRGQVVAVLGTLLAGGVYVPVAADQPTARRDQVYADARVRVVLIDEQAAIATQRDVLFLSWQSTQSHQPLAPPIKKVAPTAAAYILYTSGSTGTPKGVVISHQSALNTCTDINRRCQVGAQDRILALAALHFDLSVYDLFGVLSAGGALVLIGEHQRRDPEAWCAAIEKHQVTLWNSVPALFDMLLTWCEGAKQRAPTHLRTVMLSGDWIHRTLPARYRAFAPNGQFMAMGGATEASIWSNAFEVTALPDDWRTIPYGFPLANQCYRVVDGLERDCPDGVPGELWIGGAGVAAGYFNDPERSAAQFVTRGGERWYRTGDIGCYWPDGTLVFLGRRDTQVKVGGYRIELGEIEAALARIPGVKRGVALALGDQEKSLAAFVVPQDEALSAAHGAPSPLPDDDAALLAANSAQQATPSTGLDESGWVAGFLADHIKHHIARRPLAAYSPEALIADGGLDPRWVPLLTRWLTFLVDQGAMQRSPEGAYRWHGGFSAARRCPSQAALDAAAPAHHIALAAIMRGERAALTLLTDPVWSPDRLALLSPHTAHYATELAQLIAQLSARLQRPVRLIDFSARSGCSAAALLARLKPHHIDYIGLDASSAMVQLAGEQLAAWPHATVAQASPNTLESLAHTADVVWAHHALHRLLPHDPETLTALHRLAAPGALIYVTEYARLPPLALLSALLLSPELSEAWLITAEQWRTRLASTPLSCQHSDERDDQLRIVLRAPAIRSAPCAGTLREALALQLPHYMVPPQLYVLEALPLTANGKINRQALCLMAQAGTAAQSLQQEPTSLEEPTCQKGQTPQGDKEQYVAALWQQWLNLPQVTRETDFFLHGGDSLMATRLIGELRQAGYEATLGALFSSHTLAGFAATLRHTSAAAPLRIDADARYAPFPLTDVQRAYLVGRQPGLALSGVGAHFFIEFRVQTLDETRLAHAWNALITRHDMLRAVVSGQQQRVLEQVPPYTPVCHTLATEEEALRVRERLSHQVLDPTQWPPFDMQIGLQQGQPARVWLCLDNLFLDGMSMQQLLSELEEAYCRPERQSPPLAISFRDYRMSVASQTPSEASIAYWQAQLDTLPAAPQLPLACHPASIAVPQFTRQKGALSQQTWSALKERAARHRLTPSALLLSAYATVLSAWSQQPEFTLNLTSFDRQPLHPHLDQVLGDFTSLMLVSWCPCATWQRSAEALQRQLRRSVEHRDVSALWVMRQHALRHHRATTSMPVVFTSALGFAHDNFLAQGATFKAAWGVSQTPHVWLDNQVYESEGELRFHWDAVEALFTPGQRSAMFGQFQTLLERLSHEEAAWTQPLTALVPRNCPPTSSPSTPHRPLISPVDPQRCSSSAAAERSDSRELDHKHVVEMICTQFHRVVGRPVTAQQRFFDAGANSLHLVQLHSQL